MLKQCRLAKGKTHFRCRVQSACAERQMSLPCMGVMGLEFLNSAKARQPLLCRLAKNLIDTVRKDYQETHGYGPTKQQPSPQANAYVQQPGNSLLPCLSKSTPPSKPLNPCSRGSSNIRDPVPVTRTEQKSSAWASDHSVDTV